MSWKQLDNENVHVMKSFVCLHHTLLRMVRAWHVAQMGKLAWVYKTVMVKSERKISLGSPEGIIRVLNR